MTRQFLGEKKLNKLRVETGLDIKCASVRGNSGHKMYLLLKDGRVFFKSPGQPAEEYEPYVEPRDALGRTMADRVRLGLTTMVS